MPQSEAHPAVLVDDAGPVRRLTLNRPESLNALDGRLLSALDSALDEAATSEEVRVVVLRGAGRAFCAGYDLAGYTSNDPGDAAELFAGQEGLAARMLRIHDYSKPTIAQVHSYALAGGTDLMLACDIAICADDSWFGYVDIRFGSAAVSMFLPWVVGLRKAKELLYTGNDRIGADEALQIGLVNAVVPHAQLEDAVMTMAEEIAKNEPVVVQLTKRALNRTWEVAGFRAAQQANAELGTIIESANLPIRDEFRRRAQVDGLKAAFAWRDQRFRA
jgi:enoyl-CoA hydratase/carnithine racemase